MVSDWTRIWLGTTDQTTINSALAQQTHSSIFASLVSFTIGTTALFILTLLLIAL